MEVPHEQRATAKQVTYLRGLLKRRGITDIALNDLSRNEAREIIAELLGKTIPKKPKWEPLPASAFPEPTYTARLKNRDKPQYNM